MLSIGAGAQQQVMAVIEAMGVRNLIVESQPAPDQQAFQRLRADLARAEPRRHARHPVHRRRRRRVHGAQAVHAVEADPEAVRRHADGVRRRADVPGHRRPARSPKAASSPPRTTRRPRRSRCSAKARAIALFGGRAALGEHVKVNEQWLRVVGVCGSVISAQHGSGGGPAEDRNNVIYVPLRTAILRLEDSQSQRQDEIDGIYLQMPTADATVPASRVVRGAARRNAPRRRRLHAGRAVRAARRAAPHAAHLRAGDGRDRVHLAARRRHRHHEHHARQRPRADARDRRPPRGRRARGARSSASSCSRRR